jgi:polyhydroxybutyrate depolymerase
VPTPLVVVLHGYSANGFVQATLFGMINASDQHAFLLAYPDGTLNPEGAQFWNATDGCCNGFGLPVDDVAYLTAVLDDMEAHYNVDPKRIFFLGHSNGGFMTHRMACELGDRIAAGISLAGMTWSDPTKCAAPGVTNILQVHGDADATVPYQGTAYYPSAEVTVATWAEKNGCTGALVDMGAARDMDSSLAGAETTTQAYADCPAGGAVDFWTIHGGSHIPNISGPIYSEAFWTYFEGHAKP